MRGKKPVAFPFVLDHIILSESVTAENADSLETTCPINTPAAFADCHHISTPKLPHEDGFVYFSR